MQGPRNQIAVLAAVDQAEVELRYGKDPQMRALAKNIVKAQKEEIAYMKQWQAKHNRKM